MENIRKKNVASLIFNLGIIFFTIESFWYSFRTDVIRDPFWVGFEGIHCLRFFTVLSNLFVAVASTIMVVYNVKNIVKDGYDYPDWLILLKHIATTAVTLTFVTVVLLLAPSYAIAGKGYFTLLIRHHAFMHLVTPVCAITTFVFFENTKKMEFKKSFWALLPVSLYAIVYTTMVVFVGYWPDFYNFTFGGHMWVIPISAIGMLLVTFAISVGLLKWHNSRCSK